MDDDRAECRQFIFNTSVIFVYPGTGFALYEHANYTGRCWAFSLPANAPSNSQLGGTRLYENTAFGGRYVIPDRDVNELRSQFYDSDTPPFRGWGIQDTASSVRVSLGARATLFAEENHNGACRIATGDISNRGNALNDHVRSARIGFAEVSEAITGDPASVHVSSAARVFARSADTSRLMRKSYDGSRWLD